MPKKRILVVVDYVDGRVEKFRPPSTLTNSISLEDDRISKGLNLEVFASKTFDDMADWRMMSSSGTDESSVEMTFRFFLKPSHVP